MIKITVELISAIDGHREMLGEAIIYNDGTGTPTRGNYHAIFGKKGKTVPPGLLPEYAYRTSEVKNFPRQTKNAWWLLCAALNKALGSAEFG